MGIYILKHVVQSLVQVASFTFTSSPSYPAHVICLRLCSPGGDLLAGSDGVRVEGVLECEQEGGGDDTLSDLGSNAWWG